MSEESVDDLAALYVEMAGPLARQVKAVVMGSHPVVEDACQFAWSQLLRNRDRLTPDTVRSWLAATAIHEAIRLVRIGTREVSLEAELERGGERLLGRRQAGPDEALASQQRVEVLRALPDRQQRIIWLRALGLSQSEVAVHERCTSRTVERQLIKARRRLRALADAA